LKGRSEGERKRGREGKRGKTVDRHRHINSFVAKRRKDGQEEGGEGSRQGGQEIERK